ncbi:MAG TPA: hypothetical protein V6C97_21865 [Oculatellaceae cyanobacterium]
MTARIIVAPSGGTRMAHARLSDLLCCTALAVSLFYGSAAQSVEKSNALSRGSKSKSVASTSKTTTVEPGRVFSAHASTVKKPGWILEIASKDMGICRYFATADGFKIETPMCMLYGNFKNSMAAVANFETQKYFVFPMDKTTYYLSLMGMTIHANHKSKFEREFEQSDWKRVRELKFQELPVIEYERHVLNPPKNRTRTRYQLLTHLPFVPNRLYDFYHDIMQTQPAMPNAIVIDDRVEITNPTVKWQELSLKKAQRTALSESDLCIPASLRAVDTIADVTIGDTEKFRAKEAVDAFRKAADKASHESSPGLR